VKVRLKIILVLKIILALSRKVVVVVILVVVAAEEVAIAVQVGVQQQHFHLMDGHLGRKGKRKEGRIDLQNSRKSTPGTDWRNRGLLVRLRFCINVLMKCKLYLMTPRKLRWGGVVPGDVVPVGRTMWNCQMKFWKNRDGRRQRSRLRAV
jgi:hypothetical protein